MFPQKNDDVNDSPLFGSANPIELLDELDKAIDFNLLQQIEANETHNIQNIPSHMSIDPMLEVNDHIPSSPPRAMSTYEPFDMSSIASHVQAAAISPPGSKLSMSTYPKSLKGGKKSSGARNRKHQKDEIICLREQVEILEGRLKNLQESNSPIVEFVPDMSDPVDSLVWKNVSKRQNVAKQKAYIENTKLKSILEGQLRLSKSLERLFRRQPDAAIVKVRHVNSQQKALSMEESDIIKILQQNLDARYMKTDEVMEQSGLNKIFHYHQDAKATYDTVQGLCIESIDCTIFPFHFQKVYDAMAQCLKWSYLEVSTGSYTFISEDETTINGRFDLTLHSCRGEASACKKYISSRRYTSTNRLVVVYEGITLLGGTLGGSSNARLKDEGWIVLETSPGDKIEDTRNASASCTSLVKLYVRTSHEGTVDEDLPIGKYTDQLVQSCQGNFGAIKQAAENILVENALSGA